MTTETAPTRHRFARPQNGCVSCGLDFGSLSAFEKHRVGKHEHVFSAEHPDGRRCLTVAELEAKDFRTDIHGRWRTPIKEGQQADWSKIRSAGKSSADFEQAAAHIRAGDTAGLATHVGRNRRSRAAAAAAQSA